MQKNSNSKTKVAQPHYQLQSVKSLASNKVKSTLPTQNMREFKHEIDHQIAKCLDTLDRQGLKYLRETLRASKIFGLNTQELPSPMKTQQTHELKIIEKPAEKAVIIEKVSKEKPKTSNSYRISNNEKSKKVINPLKPQVKKNGLGERIYKKMEELNIKTGKTTKTKSTKKQTKTQKKAPQNINQIKEQIDPTQQIQEQLNQEPEANENLVFQDIAKDKQCQIEQQSSQLIKVQEIREGNQPIKPFYKKQVKKNSQKLEENNHGRQLVKEQIQSKVNIDVIDIPLEESKMQESVSMLPQKQNKKNKTENEQNSNTQHLNIKTENEYKQDLEYLMNRINKLSPKKLQKLQKIIANLQDSKREENDQSKREENNESKVSEQSKYSYVQPYISQHSRIHNKSKDKSKSKSRLEKHQKATSLYNSIVKKHNLSNQSPAQKQEKSSQVDISVFSSHDQSQIPQNFQSNILKPAGKLSLHQNQFKNLQESDKTPIETTFRPNPIQIQKSDIYLEAQKSKLIKINKKKTTGSTNKVLIKIITNNGHPSLVGLDSIQILNKFGEIIQISKQNVNNARGLKLFTNANQARLTDEDRWLSPIAKAQILIENIDQPIGGLRIWNFNKSELQSSKEANDIQIWINQEKAWTGKLNRGYNNQNRIASTNIKLSNTFEFQQENHPQTAFILEPQPQKLESLKDSAHWLQKAEVQSKIKELEIEEKQFQEKAKKSINLRASMNEVNQKGLSQYLSMPDGGNSSLIHKKSQGHQIYHDSLGKANQKIIRSSLPAFSEEDILEQFGKSRIYSKRIEPKNQKQAQSPVKKQQLLNLKKAELDKEKQRQKEKQKQREKEIQKLQDQQFQKILESMERGADKKVKIIQIPKKESKIQNKPRQIASQFDDFMNDSLFKDQSKPHKMQVKQIQRKEEPTKQKQLKKTDSKANIKDLDNLIDQLNDIVGNDNGEEQITIPQLPRGKTIQLILLQNWGSTAFIGLNAVQFFNHQGDNVKPETIECGSMTSEEIQKKLCGEHFLTTDQTNQFKIPKAKKIMISFRFEDRIDLSLIRIWNYNGHRVHTNIGIKKCTIKLDNTVIFSGQIQQSSGSSDDAFKYCENILFTNNSIVIKRINDKDWLTHIRRKAIQDKALFKSTLENFHRPKTKNQNNEHDQQQMKDIMPTAQIKLPKRMCFEYDPPQTPQGYTLKLVLHSSWGDRYFIGLNGIQIYDEKGDNINKHISSIRADPSSVSSLPGYEKDKRVVTNLINGVNTINNDKNIWLAPLQSDIQKLERGKSNLIIVDFTKPMKISGINFYNYTKTPSRGVRQIQISIDRVLLYRGYLRKFVAADQILHTTINFTKEQHLLQKMKYSGYNQDTQQQSVGLINQQKIIKEGESKDNANLSRPMTGMLDYP